MKFFSITWDRRLWTLAGLICLIGTASAQSDLTSPYSIFGPGISNQRQSVSQFTMGGSGVAITDPYRMNLINPAASAYYLEPIFETSGKGNISTFETNIDEFENQNFEINNLSLSFPVKRGKWALNLGLVPATSVGYDVNVTEEIEETGTYQTSYFGDGGVSQGYFGTGISVFHREDTAKNYTNVAVGGQLNFNFGTITNNRRIIFPDDLEALGFEDSESILMRDVTFELGVHAETNIKKKTITNPSHVKLQVGAVYRFGNEVNAEQNRYAFNFRLFSNGGILPQDTVESAIQQKGTVTLTSSFTIGTALDIINRKKMRFRWSIDYSLTNWADYDVNFEGTVLRADFNDSQRLNTGIEWTPRSGGTSYFETVEYRAGFRYEKTNLTLRDQEVDDIGMSFGLSLPLHFRRGISKSAFHVGAEYGEYGTTNEGLIKETYTRILVGFSFTPHFRNRWFVQPKYD
ncbi:MAG: hypothetical protein AAGC47_02915 [Bacteroidota bacterium]